jgi:hypothetical protein
MGFKTQYSNTPTLHFVLAPRIWTFLNSLESEFFNSLFTFDIAPSAGAKRGRRLSLLGN